MDGLFRLRSVLCKQEPFKQRCGDFDMDEGVFMHGGGLNMFPGWGCSG